MTDVSWPRPDLAEFHMKLIAAAQGGLADPIVTHSRTVQHYEPWLTLQGLRIVFERNR